MSSPRIIIGARLILLALVLGVVGGTYLMSGSLGSTAATYSVGGIDLKVDSKAFYNTAYYPQSSWSAKDLQPYYDQFFDFPDVKPGDTGTTTISLHVKKASAYVCLAFSDFKDNENGRNEPEQWVDATNVLGELGKGIEFFAWHDDGDNTFEVGEKPLFGTSSQSAIQTVKDKKYALSDYTHGPVWLANSLHYVGISWCAGNLTVNLANAKVSCDASALANEAQTDSLAFSVSLTAVPYTQDTKFVCEGKKEKPCDEDDDSIHDDHDGKDSDGDGKDHDWGNDKDDYDGKDWDKDGKDHDGEDDRNDKDGKDYDKDGKDKDGKEDSSDGKSCKDDKDTYKDEICHFTGSKKNPTNIIEVSHYAVGAHVSNHGDYVIETDKDEKDCKEGKKHDDDKEKDKHEVKGEYIWYYYGDNGNGGSCNVDKRS